MVVIFFNLIALGILILAFGAAFLIGHWLGISGEPALMMIAGPIVAVLDLLYRARTGRWFHPRGGGALFFAPVWCFGILWLALGAGRVLTPKGKPSPAVPSLAAAEHTIAPTARITSEAEGKREALRMYPSLGVANSALNVEFVRRYQQYQQEKPQFFRDPLWPVTLVSECATGLGIQQAPR